MTRPADLSHTLGSMEATQFVFERERVSLSVVASLAAAIGMTNAGRFHGAEPQTLSIADVRFEQMHETRRRQPLYRVRTYVVGAGPRGLPCDFTALALGERLIGPK
jgi:hypothetical protein